PIVQRIEYRLVSVGVAVDQRATIGESGLHGLYSKSEGRRLECYAAAMRAIRQRNSKQIAHAALESSDSVLDAVGWRILCELQENARLSFSELGRRVGM